MGCFRNFQRVFPSLFFATFVMIMPIFLSYLVEAYFLSINHIAKKTSIQHRVHENCFNLIYIKMFEKIRISLLIDLVLFIISSKNISSLRRHNCRWRVAKFSTKFCVEHHGIPTMTWDLGLQTP